MSQAEELVSYIAQSLVEQPDRVRVYTKDLRRTTILKLQVAQEDTGRVVGKHGRVASAMRSVLEVVTRDEEKPVVLEID
ncbi:MAG: KH domain-containing protein [Caldilineaceae bacterium]